MLITALACFLVLVFQSPLGEEKTYAPPYGTPSGSSPTVPDVPAYSPPYSPTPSGDSPVVSTPDVPYTPTPYTPSDPTPSTPAPSTSGSCS